MKRIIVLWAIILASCSTEMVEVPVEKPEEPTCNYIDTGVSLVSYVPDTKSVIDNSAEQFRCALLYAFDPTSGSILQYGSNAGNLSGTPVYLQTWSKTFSWPLPENKAMKIYCIVNPPDGFVDSITVDGLTETILQSKYFTCQDTEALKSLETMDTGLPMSGIANVKKGDITSELTSLSIPIKNLFAKYRFSLDLSGLEERESFRITKLAVNAGNTRLPYFEDSFCQNDLTYLKDFDYATEDQLVTLSKGGTQNYTDIYVLENCHGTHSGAGSWWSVYRDLYSSWPEIAKCTNIQMCYSITESNGFVKSYLSRIYLGSGNMVDDFDLKRNLYKNITVKASRRTSESDPYCVFTADEYAIFPGQSVTVKYGSNLAEVSSNSTIPEVWVTDSAGLETSLISVQGNNVSTGEVVIKASASCKNGEEYRINGGKRSAFFWPPYGTSASSFFESRPIKVLQSESLTFEAPGADIYPYMRADFISKERFTSDGAREMARGMKIKTLSGHIDNSLTTIGIQNIGGEYAIIVSLVPSMPGNISFTAEYGILHRITSSKTKTVLTPVLKAFYQNAECSEYHTDVCGTKVNTEWKLMTQDGLHVLDNPVVGGTLSIDKQDQYGTDLTIAKTAGSGSQSNTVCSTNMYLTGFSGLPGFNPEVYTFSGLTIPVKGSFTYNGNYSVSCTVNLVLDNPLSGYSYDGSVYTYDINQGKTAQSPYVSVNHTDYKVENMLEWPQREFSVDLTRGGTRSCNGLEVWTEYSGITSLAPFALSGGHITGVQEDLTQWGPVFYGKQIRNSYSNELVSVVHSIVRVYCYFNVFAIFDAQEKNKVKVDWNDQGNIDWSPTFMLLNYHFGSFKASLKTNFAQGLYPDQMLSLIQKDISSSTRVQPVLDGFSLDTSGSQPAHGTYSSGAHDDYQCYMGKWNGDDTSYLLGYWDDPSGLRYSINYDWIYINGVDGNLDYIYWRLIAASNKPWFKVGGGGFSSSGKYVTQTVKNASGEYCFNVLPSSSNQSKYTDLEGLGYMRLALFWEGKEGRASINSKDLSPNTNYNTNLCLVNGWYDPSLYTTGIPVLKEKVGMYFFPESTSANTRSGYPAYYSNDWPYKECTTRGSMEISLFSHLEFGELYDRDEKAAR